MRRPLWLSFTHCELAAMRQLSVPGLGIVLKNNGEERYSEEVEGNLRGLRPLDQASTVVSNGKRAHLLHQPLRHNLLHHVCKLAQSFHHPLEAYKDDSNLTCLVPTV